MVQTATSSHPNAILDTTTVKLHPVPQPNADSERVVAYCPSAQNHDSNTRSRRAGKRTDSRLRDCRAVVRPATVPDASTIDAFANPSTARTSPDRAYKRVACHGLRCDAYSSLAIRPFKESKRSKPQVTRSSEHLFASQSLAWQLFLCKNNSLTTIRPCALSSRVFVGLLDTIRASSPQHWLRWRFKNVSPDLRDG